MRKACTFAVLATALALLLPAAPAGAQHKPNPHLGIECTFCHAEAPRFGIDTRDTVTFWRAQGDEPQLCDRCHTPDENLHPLGIVPGPDRLDTRKPARLPLGASESVKDQVVCTTCHFLHASTADFYLLRGFPGSQNPNTFTDWRSLCRECHGGSLEKRSPHAGDERSCLFCHAAKPQEGQKVDSTEKGLRLCGFCHGVVEPEHYANTNPFPVVESCATCHDPHLGKDHPGRLRAGYYERMKDRVTFNPHLRRTQCFACHVTETGGALRTDDPVALCQRCHGSGEIPGMSHPLAKVPAGMAVPGGWPLAADTLTCSTCHLPGHIEDAGKPSLLRRGAPADPDSICLQCHKKDQWANRNPHREAAKENRGCELCHARWPIVGKDTSNTVTFRADITILCMRCHPADQHPGGRRHTVTMQSGREMEIPADLPLGLGNRITCSTCHNPMADTVESHLLRGLSKTEAFCNKCHKLT